MFIRDNKSHKLQIIAVYVDDLILLTETIQEMQEMKEGLANTFKMKDMGELCFCLDVNFELNDEGVSLCQKHYLMKLLSKYGLAEANTVTTTMDSNVKLEKDDGYSKKVDAVQYQSMVGSLLHAARATRPDIAFAVSTVSKFNAAAIQAHLTAVKRIYRYMKGTLDLRLQYKSIDDHLVGYSDADWANNTDNNNSITGNVFVMSGVCQEGR